MSAQVCAWTPGTAGSPLAMAALGIPHRHRRPPRTRPPAPATRTDPAHRNEMARLFTSLTGQPARGPQHLLRLVGEQRRARRALKPATTSGRVNITICCCRTKPRTVRRRRRTPLLLSWRSRHKRRRIETSDPQIKSRPSTNSRAGAPRLHPRKPAREQGHQLTEQLPPAGGVALRTAATASSSGVHTTHMNSHRTPFTPDTSKITK